jgi:GNAT superfamily N-acetyltransferase
MENYRYKLYSPFDKATSIEVDRITKCLFDSMKVCNVTKADIQHAIDYAFREKPGLGGYVLTILDRQQIVGVAIINKTGMKGYFPENILAFIGVVPKYQGKGLGKRLVQQVIRLCEGHIYLNIPESMQAETFFTRVGFQKANRQFYYKNNEGNKGLSNLQLSNHNYKRN